MANEEHLKILKQGVEAWHKWRDENSAGRPNLVAADLKGMNLHRADLSWVDLSWADLYNTNLHRANLNGAKLIGANLSRADLSAASFGAASLNEADFNQALILSTAFSYVDLSKAKGLASVVHGGPSYIDIHTIYLSRGKIPEVFLRGAGVPDTFVIYATSFSGEAFQYYSCFICYCHKDEEFAQRLHADLQQKGVRCWFAPEDMKIGAKIRPTIDQSIRIHDKLLLILSEHSINSTWVEKEVETAFEEEDKRKQTVLFPVRLDKAVIETDQAWAADIRRTRHIGDFSRWQDHGAYQQAFERLLRDLKAEG